MQAGVLALKPPLLLRHDLLSDAAEQVLVKRASQDQADPVFVGQGQQAMFGLTDKQIEAVVCQSHVYSHRCHGGHRVQAGLSR